MYKLKLNSSDCISCGICQDVCLPKAIGMRTHKGKTIEGKMLIIPDIEVESIDYTTDNLMTFPFMEKDSLCDGCLDCVKECPTSAINILVVTTKSLELAT